MPNGWERDSMARMIPSDCTRDDFNGSFGEERIYEKLKDLPDEYVIFHSVRWNRKERSGVVRWGESDFTVFDPKRGIIVIEVKAGEITCSDGRIKQKKL